MSTVAGVAVWRIRIVSVSVFGSKAGSRAGADSYNEGARSYCSDIRPWGKALRCRNKEYELLRSMTVAVGEPCLAPPQKYLTSARPGYVLPHGAVNEDVNCIPHALPHAWCFHYSTIILWGISFLMPRGPPCLAFCSSSGKLEHRPLGVSMMPAPRACDSCKVRKVKCDMADPCANCRISHICCAYTILPRKRGRKVGERMLATENDNQPTRLEQNKVQVYPTHQPRHHQVPKALCLPTTS